MAFTVLYFTSYFYQFPIQIGHFLTSRFKCPRSRLSPALAFSRLTSPLVSPRFSFPLTLPISLYHNGLQKRIVRDLSHRLP